MIVWGGSFDTTGGRYNTGNDSWTATSIVNAPSGRAFHTAVWTGVEMVIWGGNDENNYLGTGGRYTPATDSWTVTADTAARSMRAYHTAVWNGSEMIIWGGLMASTSSIPAEDTARNTVLHQRLVLQLYLFPLQRSHQQLAQHLPLE